MSQLVRSPALGVAVLAPIVLVAGAGSAAPSPEVSNTAVTAAGRRRAPDRPLRSRGGRRDQAPDELPHQVDDDDIGSPARVRRQ